MTRIDGLVLMEVSVVCPAAYELLLLRQGRLSEGSEARVREHIARCKRCQTVLAYEGDIWGPVEERSVPEAVSRLFQAGSSGWNPPDSRKPGQIWMTRDVPGIVLITLLGEQQDLYRTHPISFETRYVSDRDVWLGANDSPLGAPAMVETWLEVPLDAQGLSHFLGTVNDDLLDLIRRVADGEELGQEDRLMGPALVGPGDPRYDFQLRELELWEPASERVSLRFTENEEDAPAQEAVWVADLAGGGFVYGVEQWAGSETGRLVCERYPTHLAATPTTLLVQVAVAHGHVQWVQPGETVPITSNVSEVVEHGVVVLSVNYAPVQLTATR